MACGGKCTITKRSYGKTTVKAVKPLTPGAPAIPANDPEAQASLDAAAQSNPTEIAAGCESGCRCSENAFQSNVPPGKPNTAANVPKDKDTVPVLASLTRGNNAYQVEGTCEVETQVLDGHCVPLLLVSVPAYHFDDWKITPKLDFKLKSELKYEFEPPRDK
jgi:hypothetical protein